MNHELLKDFLIFAQAEINANDIEPWAAMFRVAYLEASSSEQEDVWWLATLYNTHDRVDSALRHYQRWPSPRVWDRDPNKADAASHELYPRATERRNLHGTAVLKRHQGYADAVAPYESPLVWLCSELEYDSPGEDFRRLTAQMRMIWGVGRQAAFEWAEFAGKVVGLPVDAADGQLYDSSGPRQSIELMYNAGAKMTEQQLNEAAEDLQARLSLEGMEVSFVDLETLVCDFKVMCNGGYFVGRHLTALKGEIQGNLLLESAFEKVVPPDWRAVPPGLDMDPKLRGHYKRTGEIFKGPWWKQ